MIRAFILSFVLLLGTVHAQAEKIIIIGDSLTCGPFGDRMYEDLKSQKHQVTLYCAVSSSATNWLNGTTPKNQRCFVRGPSSSKQEPCPPSGKVPRAEDLLAANTPDRVIVALGTNSLHSATASKDHATLATLVGAKSRCTWVGPPQLKHDFQKNLDRFYDSLGGRLGTSCDLVDSRDATAPGTPGYETTDGIHRTRAAGRAWYDFLHKQIRSGNSNRKDSGSGWK